LIFFVFFCTSGNKKTTRANHLYRIVAAKKLKRSYKTRVDHKVEEFVITKNGALVDIAIWKQRFYEDVDVYSGENDKIVFRKR
jgi:predicted phosphohydrolase